MAAGRTVHNVHTNGVLSPPRRLGSNQVFCLVFVLYKRAFGFDTWVADLKAKPRHSGRNAEQPDGPGKPSPGHPAQKAAPATAAAPSPQETAREMQTQPTILVNLSISSGTEDTPPVTADKPYGPAEVHHCLQP